jgi:hypothetical protein
MEMNRHLEDPRRASSVWRSHQQWWCASVCISEGVSHECWMCPKESPCSW